MNNPRTDALIAESVNQLVKIKGKVCDLHDGIGDGDIDAIEQAILDLIRRLNA